MSEACSAKFLLTKKELQRGIRRHHRFKLRRIVLVMRIVAIVLLALLCFVCLTWLFSPSTSAAPSWNFLVVAVFSLYFIFIVEISAWNSGRGFRKRPDANSRIEWEFSGNEIKTRSEFSEATMAWKSFTKVIETKDGFLFYPLMNLFYWIPFEAFDDPSCVEKVRVQIKQNDIPLLGP